MTVNIDDSQTEAAPPQQEEEWVPRAFDRESFLAIPEDRRHEAAKRAAFLMVRGETPARALSRAQSGMLDDESMRERPVAWDYVAQICDFWLSPHRDTEGHPKVAILDAADLLRSLVDAAVDEGHVATYASARDSLRQFCPNDESLDRALRIYCLNAGVVSPADAAAAFKAAASETTAHDDPMEDGVDDIPTFADAPVEDDLSDIVF